ncbi:MAG: substrate-binding domain-containing protein [Lentisphaeria bacterium]|nr:substrate-binding domain-containing protein [Lentisphaeria bacterium]
MVLIHDLNKKMQQDILNGVFEDTLPSIRLLAEKYHVGASTMKLSLKQLKEDGYLIGHQGKCIQVNPLAAGNLFFKKNIVFFIKLLRLQQPLYSQILESLRLTFETKGANVHLVNSMRQLVSLHFDVDILILTEIKDTELQAIIDKSLTDKIIFLNGYSNTYANVGTDNVRAGYEAIQYLHEVKKHNHIGILSMYLDYELSFNKFRRDGAWEYCKQHPEVTLTEVDTENFNSCYDAIEDLFARDKNLTAIFATMDPLAFSVYAYAAKNNISIPSQLAVLGFDNSFYSEFAVPPLTTFAEDIKGINQALLRLTQDKLTGGKETGEHLSHPVLVVRESV